MNCSMQRSLEGSEQQGLRQDRKLRWPVWADEIIRAEGGAVEPRKYEEGEAYPWCVICEKWCAENHITSKMHERRKKMYTGSRLIESSSSHSETCNAQGASYSVIHSNISQREEIVQQERVQHCSVERAQNVGQVPASVPRWRVQQRSAVYGWQDWQQWQRNGWQWW